MLEELIFGSDITLSTAAVACFADCADMRVTLLLVLCSSFGSKVALPVSGFFDGGWPDDVPLLQNGRFWLHNLLYPVG